MPTLPSPAIAWFTAALPPPAVVGAPAETQVVFVQTTLMLVLATAIGFVGSRLKQPLIVSFIAVGILVGPFGLNLVNDPHSLELLAEIGICILLFIVGLKLDLAMVRTMGRVALATGLGQVLFTSLGGFGLARLLGMEMIAAVYVAVALTFSSTIIIVKLLSDKREIDALHGRIAIGFLIVQDLAVVLAMITLSAYGAGAAGEQTLLWKFGNVILYGIAFLGGVLLLMRRALPWLLEQLARVPELLVLFAIAWAVGLAAFGDWLGFSKEVGAFVAGMSIASTPYRDALGARLISLRDFLLLFFFIHLGSSLNLSLLGGEIVPAVVFSMFVLIGNPLIVMVIMGRMGYRKRTGFLAGLTVAQISEFSLILIGLGAALGHVDAATVGLVTLVGLITIGLSTYMILYSGHLYRWLAPSLRIFERRIPYREETADEQDALSLPRVDVLMFGLGHYGGSIVRGLIKRGQRVVGVDFDPQILRYWREQRVPVLYGDMEDPDLLEHLPIQRTRWILVATPNRQATTTLVSLLRAAHYPGKLALTARTRDDAAYYETLGADLVLRPYADAADQAVDALNAAMHLLPDDSDWPTSLLEVRLETGAVWAGKPLGEIPLRQQTGVSILAASRAGKTAFDPAADFVLYPGDRLVLLGEPDNLAQAAVFITRREFGPQDDVPSFTIARVDVPATCGLGGKTLGELNFRRDFGISVIGIERGDEQIRTLTAATTVESRDRLIVAGSQAAVDNLHAALIDACAID
ncbi:MAG: cation:proton antiporter [Candidatus Krumholzibacteria bacterium]|jgi:Kef-type K+ transport system membrane component KefB/Trk K+ transport system NAD-binding subunit|nr:cation:proton antiporter [Candidatus Krumholzibacteria bacterium]